MRISDWSSDVCSSELERLVQTNTLQIFLTCRKFTQVTEIFPPINGGQFAKSPEIPVEIEIGTAPAIFPASRPDRSEEHTSELQSLMRISYAVFCLKKKKKQQKKHNELIHITS